MSACQMVCLIPALCPITTQEERLGVVIAGRARLGLWHRRAVEEEQALPSDQTGVGGKMRLGGGVLSGTATPVPQADPPLFPGRWERRRSLRLVRLRWLRQGGQQGQAALLLALGMPLRLVSWPLVSLPLAFLALDFPGLALGPLLDPSCRSPPAWSRPASSSSYPVSPTNFCLLGLGWVVWEGTGGLQWTERAGSHLRPHLHGWHNLQRVPSPRYGSRR